MRITDTHADPVPVVELGDMPAEKAEAIKRVTAILEQQTSDYCVSFASSLSRRYPPTQPPLRLAE